MGVSYTGEVATAKFTTFCKLLFRWKASILKMALFDTIIFAVVHVAVSMIYHRALNCERKWRFNEFHKYCTEHSFRGGIALTFVLGLYTALVIKRWWSIQMAIAWPDRAMYYIGMAIPSDEPESIQYRRNILRYLNLSQLLTLRDVSTAVKTRFPTCANVVTDKFMSDEEREIVENVRGEFQLERHCKYWLPVQWVSTLLCRANERGKVRDAYTFNRAFAELIGFGEYMRHLLIYDWINIPLAYTQLVALVLYIHMAILLVRGQALDKVELVEAQSNRSCKDESVFSWVKWYLPIFPALEFLFYIGWLKVCAAIMNPLGTDDDDIEINYIIDRNQEVAYAVVTEYKESRPRASTETLATPSVTKIMAKSFRGSAEKFCPINRDKPKRKPRKKQNALATHDAGLANDDPPSVEVVEETEVQAGKTKKIASDQRPIELKTTPEPESNSKTPNLSPLESRQASDLKRDVKKK